MRDEMLSVFLFVNKISSNKWNNILKTINKRHERDDWIYISRNWDGNKIKYISSEGQEWIMDVYLNKEKTWVDNEISFSLKKIELVLSDEMIYKKLNYRDMVADELKYLLNCDISEIYKEMNLLVKEYPNYIYLNEKNIKTVSGMGVKHIEENYHKRNYWKRLEEIRICEMLTKKRIII